MSRCIACHWGFGRFDMLNVFAFVATHPKEMLAVADPVGPENDEWLRRITSEANLVVAAWGTHGTHLGRSQQVQGMLGHTWSQGSLGLWPVGHWSHFWSQSGVSARVRGGSRAFAPRLTPR